MKIYQNLLYVKARRQDSGFIGGNGCLLFMATAVDLNTAISLIGISIFYASGFLSHFGRIKEQLTRLLQRNAIASAEQHVICEYKMKKAYEVTLYDFISICFAETPAKAKWIAVSGYWDTYGKNGWPDVSVRREPQFDNSPLKNGKCVPWTRDHVLFMQAETDNQANSADAKSRAAD